MSMHSYYKCIVDLLLILMVALSIPLGMFEASKYGYVNIFESYKAQIPSEKEINEVMRRMNSEKTTA